MSQVLGLVTDCAQATDAEHVVKTALRTLPALCGADAVLHLRRHADEVRVMADEGVPLSPAGAADADLLRGGVPRAWREVGISWVDHHPLPGTTDALVLAWCDPPARPDPALAVALTVLDTVVERVRVTEEYDDLVARVDNAQQLANMGDYDWHIASDTNRWSDQLYRIYGYEPQSFNASYERFLGMLHPEDRERIQAVHQEAYRTGEPHQMVERIIRPDGQVRHLLSNGQVLMDATGRPSRFRGTCIDITDQVLAEQAREEIAARMAEDRERRRQALEINDSVVQGLVAATYALETGDVDQAAQHLAGTLSRARGMMDDLMVARDQLSAGDLVRRSAADFSAPGDPDPDDPRP